MTSVVTLSLTMGKGRATDTIYLDFFKTLDMVPHNIFLSNLDGFNEWTVRCIRKLLDWTITSRGSWSTALSPNGHQ